MEAWPIPTSLGLVLLRVSSCYKEEFLKAALMPQIASSLLTHRSLRGRPWLQPPPTEGSIITYFPTGVRLHGELLG